MLKKTLKYGLYSVILLIVLFTAGQVLGPHLASWYIKREVTKRCPECGRIHVSLDVFPFGKLFFMD